MSKRNDKKRFRNPVQSSPITRKINHKFETDVYDFSHIIRAMFTSVKHHLQIHHEVVHIQFFALQLVPEMQDERTEKDIAHFLLIGLG